MARLINETASVSRGAGLQVIDGGKSEPKPIKDGQPGADGMTNKQRAFAKAMLKGAGSQSAAYRSAYNAEAMSDHAVSTEASALMRHPAVTRYLDQGFAAQDKQTAHSGASLRLKLEHFLNDVIDGKHGEVVVGDDGSEITMPPSLTARLRAADLLGKSEKVSFFLDRSADVPTEELTAEQIRERLREKLGAVFPGTGT